MNRFQHVEDYIEIIAGFREPNGKKTSSWNAKSPLSLARYDVNFIQSLASQTCHPLGSAVGGTANLTDKQAELAIKLIRNYKRQLNALGVDISPVENEPEFRNPLRYPDRSKQAFIKDNLIHLKFPYNQDMINKIREWSKTSQGTARFNHDLKVWEFGLTEYNVSLAAEFGSLNKFTIDPTLLELNAKITEVEQSGWDIRLSLTDNGVTLDNAADSLIAYLNEHKGGITIDNLLTLVNISALFGYSVAPNILEAIEKEYGSAMRQIMEYREIKVDPDKDFIKIVNEYATLVNAFPFFVYEQVGSNMMLEEYKKFYGAENVFVYGQAPEMLHTNTKVIWSNKTFKELDKRIPLLVSHTGLPQVGYRSMLMERSDKIIYAVKHVFRAAAEDASLSKIPELKV